MTVETNITFTDKDLGKNLYRKKTYYTLMIEQEVLADNEAEADHKFLDFGALIRPIRSIGIKPCKFSLKTIKTWFEIVSKS